MGKPSSSNISKQSHNRSRSNSSEHKMRTVKVTNTNRRKKAKLNKKIKKLFNNLRRESIASISSENVIDLSTVTEEKTPRKRKSLTYNSPENKKRKLNDSNIIEINDDTPTKLSCSTPLPMKNQPGPANLNISAISSTNLDKDVKNLTREINSQDYTTIDLTGSNLSVTAPTVIDVNNVSEHQDCVIVSTSNASLSGDSDVTVLRAQSKPSTDRINRLANGLANLDRSKLLELITKTLGCEVRKNQTKEPHVPETVEDTYIKEVILGQKPSRNSIGSNIYNPEKDAKKTGLRMIVIDGSNVAMEHGRGRIFSVKGLKICIDYFFNRGHAVKAFVPRFRCKFGKSSDPNLLNSLERQGLVVFTPSREIQGKMITSYDDRYIVQCAAEFDGVIVSGDNYRDLLQENPRWRRVIEQRLLPFTWVQDMIMFPRDPMGRNGPTLEQFLRHP